MKLRWRVAGDPWLYAVARVVLVTAVKLYGRYELAGAWRLPARGPAVIVANHHSDADPVFLGVAVPRTLHFLADSVQTRRPILGPVIERLAVVPINKGQPDRHALESALDLLRRGGVIVVFGEGDLFRQTEVAPFGAGIGFLAARSGAPLVPVAITGAERIFDGRRVHRPRVRVSVGPPIVPDGRPGRGRALYDSLAEEARAAVVSLADADRAGT